MAANNKDKEAEYGVLLYYKFTSIPDLDSLFTFYDSNCRSLALLGRVRLSLNGVNVTVGGNLSSLEEHIAAVRSNNLFEGTDFKLASCHQPLNDKVAKECGFTSLSIRVVKELVTFSSHPLLQSPEVSNAGRHLSASEFHSVLQHAEKGIPDDHKRLILLDARNLYETRIGKFQIPNIETLDPEIRQYSDLHSWIDNNSEQLRGNSVLMYCTGGIRCEMASAYIKSKGDGFEDVFQALLMCDLLMDAQTPQKEGSQYICELCQKNGKMVGSIPLIVKDDSQELSMPIELEAVRTLDHNAFSPQLPQRHGKNASSFKGRTASLAKKLKNVADLVFVNAPHELPFIYQPFLTRPNDCASSSSPSNPPPPSTSCSKKFAWFIAPNFSGNSGSDWKIADGPFNRLQYQDQTDGFDASFMYLKNLFSETGPFDGMLGFSQGAAMAASVCAHKKLPKDQMDFKFVILCSGFAHKLEDHKQGSIDCPSLHIFGNDQGNDRQISSQASRELASLFNNGCSVIIEHEFGHIIPTRSPYIDEIKGFLHRFL
ncbi:hypothetical protein U1Q18_035682 [Sarracenia purpurea var. burkii]